MAECPLDAMGSARAAANATPRALAGRRGRTRTAAAIACSLPLVVHSVESLAHRALWNQTLSGPPATVVVVGRLECWRGQSCLHACSRRGQWQLARLSDSFVSSAGSARAVAN